MRFPLLNASHHSTTTPRGRNSRSGPSTPSGLQRSTAQCSTFKKPFQWLEAVQLPGTRSTQWRFSMKKGVILYIAQGKEDVPLQSAADLIRTARSLGVAAVRVAITEEEAVHGWWSLLTRGMQQVLFMTADYNGVLDKFESQGAPVRLCG